jgi:UDP-N-acetylbacillosamine N-acetyltransferase
MPPKIVVWGAGGQAMVVADIIRLRGDYELVGFLDDVNPERAGSSFCDAPILGGREQLDTLFAQGVRFTILAFGNSLARLALAELVRGKGYELATAVHPRATIATATRIGAGSVIKPGAVIDPGVTIGENGYIGAGACVGHGSAVADAVRISAGVNLSGNVTVGRATMIGAGTAVKHRIRIGANVLIGAGSSVVRDIPDGVVAYGTPARVRRAITPDDY